MSTSKERLALESVGRAATSWTSLLPFDSLAGAGRLVAVAKRSWTEWVSRQRRRAVATPLPFVVLASHFLSFLAPAEAQEGSTSTAGALLGPYVKAVFVWTIVAAVLYFVSLSVAGRLVGLPMKLLSGCLSMLVGGVLILVLSFVAGTLFGDELSPMAAALLSQLLTVGGMWLAVKLVFGTDFPRALLMVLMASTVTLAVVGLAVVVIY